MVMVELLDVEELMDECSSERRVPPPALASPWPLTENDGRRESKQYAYGDSGKRIKIR